MSARDTCLHLLTRLDQAIGPMEAAVALLDEDQLAFRPALACTPLGALIRHAYEAALAMILGVAEGGVTKEQWEALSREEPGGFGLERLRELAVTSREHTRALHAALTDDQAEAEVPYFFGLNLGGVSSLTIAHQEFLHHRGQVSTYLRVLGLTPPDIYADGM